MVNKKAFLRTMEAAIAVVLTFAVLFYFLPKIPTAQTTPSQDVLSGLQYNDEFRSCALERNETCVNETVYDSLPALYRQSYIVKLTNDQNYIPELPADKEVKTESLYIAASMTEYSPVIVKLFYWA